MMTIDSQILQQGLATAMLKPRVITLETIDSTNSYAKDLLVRGLTQDIVIVAESQQSGRGRHDRQWHSPVGGLYMSVSVKTPLEGGNVAVLALLTGCAVVYAIQKMTGLPARLKWPNDIMLSERKVGGVLGEAITVGDKTTCIVMGIGINQNTYSKDLPAEFRDRATTILTELGHKTSREELAYRIVNEIDARLALVKSQLSFSSILDEWLRVNVTIGKVVRIDDGTHRIQGKAMGITSAGALKVRAGMKEIEISAGDVLDI